MALGVYDRSFRFKLFRISVFMQFMQPFFGTVLFLGISGCCRLSIDEAAATRILRAEETTLLAIVFYLLQFMP